MPVEESPDDAIADPNIESGNDPRAVVHIAEDSDDGQQAMFLRYDVVGHCFVSAVDTCVLQRMMK